ncbi:hypothetical protein MBM_00217 [Drepanopeziza brunnea f. sp. 'multigermtubi' MB_m1]|uniref:Uncharacterized protein n=1 Tax=Marssonina brunnea f. sp. multigermtubi (strain MB_m1) TaxID=1072389 RepID=K1Y7M5_MARBU|nr:uncharacterized protein MBM_00217 [Drepanopeziza brunnea f. sp. 'multigermtubi' MB_m1]EKD21104.1 hypothetical protein MBM_00217 [Drepanopeziza brunnea f. sp. 'multigermtubi' MB_m1]
MASSVGESLPIAAGKEIDVGQGDTVLTQVDRRRGEPRITSWARFSRELAIRLSTKGQDIDLGRGDGAVVKRRDARQIPSTTYVASTCSFATTYFSADPSDSVVVISRDMAWLVFSPGIASRKGRDHRVECYETPTTVGRSVFPAPESQAQRDEHVGAETAVDFEPSSSGTLRSSEEHAKQVSQPSIHLRSRELHVAPGADSQEHLHYTKRKML